MWPPYQKSGPRRLNLRGPLGQRGLQLFIYTDSLHSGSLMVISIPFSVTVFNLGNFVISSGPQSATIATQIAQISQNSNRPLRALYNAS